MPELPEVEVVRRGLVEHVVGRVVAEARITGARVARRHPAGPADLAARLAGTRVVAADRRGKYLWLVLDPPDATGPGRRPDDGRGAAAREALVLHLGMSGQLLVEPAAAPPRRHLHATIAFADAGPHLRFVDQRTFGGLALADLRADPHAPPARGGGAAGRPGGHPDGVPHPVAHVAPDPLEAAFDAAAVVATIRSRRSAIKRVLLDQRVLSGVGNIYADEALWRAGIHGTRPAAALSRPAARRLLGHVGDVFAAALAAGGTSFDALYVNVNGDSGYFDRSLDVYGRAGAPCARCGTPIRREPFMNRSSYSCPRCQPAPRVLGLSPTSGGSGTRIRRQPQKSRGEEGGDGPG